MKIRVVKDQVTAASIAIAVLLVVGFLVVYFLSLNANHTATQAAVRQQAALDRRAAQVVAQAAVRASDRSWCSALSLLTGRPVPKPADPKANPSRENAYLFYQDLRALEIRFHC